MMSEVLDIARYKSIKFNITEEDEQPSRISENQNHSLCLADTPLKKSDLYYNKQINKKGDYLHPEILKRSHMDPKPHLKENLLGNSRRPSVLDSF